MVARPLVGVNTLCSFFDIVGWVTGGHQPIKRATSGSVWNTWRKKTATGELANPGSSGQWPLQGGRYKTIGITYGGQTNVYHIWKNR